LRKTNEEKFSYVVLRKEKVGLGEEKGDEGHNRLSEEVHLEWPLRKEEWGRIIRSPLKKRGHVVMDVCYPDGALRRSVVTKGKEGRLPLFYRAARKSQWGGLYPAYNFAETTEILPEEEEEEEPQQ
jgi:ribosomal protein RSM22 (predicted rRNA methylase)